MICINFKCINEDVRYVDGKAQKYCKKKDSKCNWCNAFRCGICTKKNSCSFAKINNLQKE